MPTLRQHRLRTEQEDICGLLTAFFREPDNPLIRARINDAMRAQDGRRGHAGLSTGAGRGLTDAVAARVYVAAAITLANAAETYVAYDTTRWDTGGMVDLPTNPTRITAPRAGYYAVGMMGLTINAPANTLDIYILVSRTSAIFETSNPDCFGDGRISGHGIWKAAANDYFETRIYNNSGANRQHTGEMWAQLLFETS